jgi:hypothetical protein
MKLYIMQFSPFSCHLISLRSKYPPQHPRHYAASRKVVGWRPDEVNEFFQFNSISVPWDYPGIYSAPHGNEYKEQKNVSGEYTAADAYD